MKMLVIDDECIIRTGIINSFDWNSIGIGKVFEASDGCEALKVFAEELPDIVITDIRMPKMSGLDLVKEIIKIKPNTKILILSGYDDFAYAKEAIHLGVKEYLLKPAKIENIVSVVKRLIEETGKENEFKLKKEKLEKHMERNISVIRNKYLNDLVTGKFSAKDEVSECLHFVNIDFEKNFFIVAAFSIDNFKANPMWDIKTDLDLVKSAVINISAELLETKRDGVVFEDSEGRIVAILCMEEKQYKNQVLDFLDSVRNQIAQSLTITVTIGAGNVYEGIEGIRQSYEEALCCIQSKFVLGKDKVFEIGDLDDIDIMQDEQLYPIQTEKEIISSVKVGNIEKLKEEMDNYFETICKTNIKTFEEIKERCIRILVSVSNNFLEMEMFDSEAITSKFKIEDFEHLETISEIKKYMLGVLLEYTELVIEKCLAGNMNAVFTAKQYVKNNMNGDLSLKTVANLVHMSPNYFTLIFKNIEGMTFFDYVHKEKIELCKRLLLTSDYKIYEVAEMVGYQDSRYFSQFFKNNTGYTPTEYRNLSLKNKI